MGRHNGRGAGANDISAVAPRPAFFLSGRLHIGAAHTIYGVMVARLTGGRYVGAKTRRLVVSRLIFNKSRVRVAPVYAGF